MPADIYIKVEGIERIQAALTKFPRQIGIYVGKAGQEAAKNVILRTQGLQQYPPAGAGNRPPYPYYQRGLGTWTSQQHNTGKSENLGKQWYVNRDLSAYTTEIGNRASYAKWVHGEEQNRYMPFLGWKRLRQVAEEKIVQITKVYQAWINKCINDLGL